MIANYYTLLHVSRSLNVELHRSVLVEIFCQNKNELLLTVESAQGFQTLLVSCEPTATFLYLRKEVPRAKRNSLDFFPQAHGRLITTVSIHPHDRVLSFSLDNDMVIVVQLFGSKSNILLVNHAGTIVDAFLHSKEVVGERLSVAHDPAAHHSVTFEEFRSILGSVGTIILPAALKRVYPRFGPVLIRELYMLAGVSEENLAAELSQDALEHLFKAAQSLETQLVEHPVPCIYYEGDSPQQFSIIPLRRFHEYRCEQFDSLHRALLTYIGGSRKRSSLEKEKERIQQFMLHAIERADRTLKKIADETVILERALSYERFGKLLMANLQEMQKGQKEVILENIFEPQRELIAIPLDVHLNPAKNAERYFDKAKKARAGVQEKIEHKEELVRQWEILQELRDLVEPLQTSDQLAEFFLQQQSRLIDVGFRISVERGGEKKELPPFRLFTVAGGFQVWAGKSSENNDVLTMKHAKPSDLWFHTRGSSGSHVILRTGTGKGQPSKQAIEQAAAIAAYYSKMKNAKHVPVAMTERKYVRKPKGAPAGTVVLEREKLLFVEPRLPEQ
ncbi:MAG: NFACT RNA binding domain-containing protein [bacterium]